MGLRFDPVGGGQFKQAVQAIIEAESQPLKGLQKTKAVEEAKMKLFQEFKSKFAGVDKAISEISNFNKLRELKVDLGDGTNLVGVTLDKERAQPGKYTIEIEELANQTSVITNGFENPDDPVLGTGFVTLYGPDGDSVDVYVDDKNSSLRGIANQINQEPKSPVQASVIRDDTDPDAPYKILFSAKKEGDQNQIDPPDLYFMEGASDLYIDDDREAQNAELTIDGFDIELASNDVKDFLQGVNMHLKQARPGQPFTMTISEDYQKISGKVKNLVDQLNQIFQFIIKQNTIDEKTDTKSTFAGDTTLQTMEYRVRNLIHDSFGAENPKTGDIEPIFLNQIGVEFEKTGQLSFKEDKFNKALEDNFDMIAQAISGPDGFANSLKGIFDGFTRLGSGSLSVKEQGLRARIKQIDDQIDQKNLYLDRKKQAVVDQFSRLEGTIGNLQRQQQYLSATLGGAGGGNPITQLLGG